MSRATAWISSTMTVRTDASVARLRSAVTMRYSDSGVVTKKLGGRRNMAARAEAVVSPLRTSARRLGAANPIRAAVSAISRNGISRFCWMSTASALSGET